MHLIWHSPLLLRQGDRMKTTGFLTYFLVLTWCAVGNLDAQQKTTGTYPYGIPVPGKPGLVESPYSPGKYVDVRGYKPGTEIKDPFKQKIFLVTV